MNIDGFKEPFHKKHQYVFVGLIAKFAGFPEDIKERYENVFKKVGGRVDSEACITFVQKNYFNNTENCVTEEFFDVEFLKVALKEKKMPPLENFRFTIQDIQNRRNSIPCCWASLKILKNGDCQKFYNQNIECVQCTIVNNHQKNRTPLPKKVIWKPGFVIGSETADKLMQNLYKVKTEATA